MSNSDLDTIARTKAITGAILIVSFVGIGLSLMIPLLSIEMERMGVSSTMNGVNTAFGGLANIVVAPLVPWFAARIGMKPVLVATVATAILTILAFKALPDFWVWLATRFLFGAAIGIMFVLSEYWIAVTAPPAHRGIIMGIYATVLAIGFALGPAILALTGTVGWAPYLAAAALFSLAFAPLWLAPDTAPRLEEHQKVTVWPLIKIAPVATLAALVFGALETGGFSQIPVFGLRSGLAEKDAALLVTYAALGNLLFQIPIGWLSDQMDRRVVLLGCALLGVIGNGLMVLLPPTGAGFTLLLLIWGGITGAIYTVGLAHLGSRFSGNDVAIANAVFIMLYSAGMIVGPPLVGSAMDLFGPNGLPLALGGMLAAYAGMVVWRIARVNP